MSSIKANMESERSLTKTSLSTSTFILLREVVSVSHLNIEKSEAVSF